MKRNKSDRKLAIFGGKPFFPKVLHVGAPNIGDQATFFGRVQKILDDRYLTNNGVFVQEFEKKISEITQVKHCITVCNATIGLELLIRALDLHGEVIVPSYTFIATVHAIQNCGLTPVFADIDPTTQNLDPREVEKLISDKTSAILGVHLWGRPCAIGDLERIAKQHKIKLFFDAAHAFACTSDGKAIGNFGEAEVFSFHATKFLNSSEGGAIVTNDDKLASHLRDMRNFGFQGLDNVTSIGTNAKMPEMSAAMGLTSLDAMQSFIDINRDHYHLYASELKGIAGLAPVTFNESERCNFQYVVFNFVSQPSSITRDDLIKVLWAENVRARKYFYPGCHRMEPYRTMFPNVGTRLPVTESVASMVLLLPTGTGVSSSDIVEICRIIRYVIENGVKISVDMMSRDIQQAS